MELPAFSTFQTRTVLSQLPLTTIVPHGENATAVTPKVCPAKGIACTGLPLLAFQTQTVLSQLPLTTLVPHGENATEYTRSSCMASGLLHVCVRARAIVPQISSEWKGERPRNTINCLEIDNSANGVVGAGLPFEIDRPSVRRSPALCVPHAHRLVGAPSHHSPVLKKGVAWKIMLDLAYR